jgi:hypothetical protein
MHQPHKVNIVTLPTRNGSKNGAMLYLVEGATIFVSNIEIACICTKKSQLFLNLSETVSWEKTPRIHTLYWT